MFNVDLNCSNESMCMLYPHALLCALIAVDEIIKSHNNLYGVNNKKVKFYEEVKTEINKL